MIDAHINLIAIIIGVLVYCRAAPYTFNGTVWVLTLR